jgi:DNA-binding CsgD family transcriptional regulator
MPFSDYEKTEYYNDFLKKEDLYYEIAVPLKMRNNLVGGIGIFRQKGEGNFTLKDCEIINTIAGHIASNFYNITKITELKKEKQELSNTEHKNVLLPAEENTESNANLNLTRRELEIINLVDEGLNNNEIADRLYVSFHTVKTHLERIYDKLDVNSRTAMLYKYREMQKNGNL